MRGLKSLSALIMGALSFGSAFAAGPGTAWSGAAACEGLFASLPLSLPGGAVMTGRDGISTLYTLPEGGELRIEGPVVRREPLAGATFQEALTDLRERAPLDLRSGDGPLTGVVLARVDNEYNGELSLYGDANGFGANAGGAELLIQPTVYLASWAGYANASDSDRTLWDRALCEQAHHELGHILLAAQVMAEAEPGLSAITSTTRAGISQAARDALNAMMAHIRARQELYHTEIKSMGESFADSRPYLELPFSWLVGD